MSAYATVAQPSVRPELLRTSNAAATAVRSRSDADDPESDPTADAVVLDGFVSVLVERVADAVVARLTGPAPEARPEWLDSRRAADYLGLPRDTLRKLATEGAIPAEQDAPGCKLFFRRCDLDGWRRGGGRAAHLSGAIAA